MHVIENNAKPATVAQIAAMEFEAVKEFRGLTRVRRLKKLHGIADDVRAMAVLASEILGLDKAELVEKINDKHETWGPFLMQLAYAKDNAKLLMDILAAAEARMAVALAVVEGPQMEAEGDAS